MKFRCMGVFSSREAFKIQNWVKSFLIKWMWYWKFLDPCKRILYWFKVISAATVWSKSKERCVCVYNPHVCSCIGIWSGIPLNLIIGSLHIIIRKITLRSLKTFSLKESTANVGVFFFGDRWPTGHPHNKGLIYSHCICVCLYIM